MSMKSAFLETAAMLALASTGTYIPVSNSRKEPTKNRGFGSKKCKSCAKYCKGSYRCGNGNSNACGDYIKRNKR